MVNMIINEIIAPAFNGYQPPKIDKGKKNTNIVKKCVMVILNIDQSSFKNIFPAKVDTTPISDQTTKAIINIVVSESWA